MSEINHSTPLIDVNTKDYPLYLKDISPRLEFPTSLGAGIDPGVLLELGYAVVEHTEIPNKDVVTEGAPELVDGVWKRTWVCREFNDIELASRLEQTKANLLSSIEQLRVDQFAIGFPHVFGKDKVTYHVQVRDGDRANLLSKRTRAMEAIGAKKTDYRVGYHVYENVTVELTAEEMVAMADAADDQTTSAYGVIWQLKAAVNKAITLEELPELPESIFT